MNDHQQSFTIFVNNPDSLIIKFSYWQLQHVISTSLTFHLFTTVIPSNDCRFVKSKTIKGTLSCPKPSILNRDQCISLSASDSQDWRLSGKQNRLGHSTFASTRLTSTLLVDYSIDQLLCGYIGRYPIEPATITLTNPSIVYQPSQFCCKPITQTEYHVLFTILNQYTGNHTKMFRLWKSQLSGSRLMVPEPGSAAAASRRLFFDARTQAMAIIARMMTPRPAAPPMIP
jgi:hypothetical protein